MSNVIDDLLDGNRRYLQRADPDRLREAAEGQRPPVVSICCSDSRVPQEGMFDVTGPGELFTPSTIGNQVWDRVDGERVVDGSVLYPLLHTGTRTAAVVGHTGCGAVTAALAAHRGQDPPTAPGLRKRVGMLVPVVADALADGVVAATDDDAVLVDRLVEANVRAQCRFLAGADAVPDGVRVVGLVYDLTGAYGDDRGRTYLVWADGVTDPKALAEQVGPDHRDAVRSLLD